MANLTLVPPQEWIEGRQVLDEIQELVRQRLPRVAPDDPIYRLLCTIVPPAPPKLQVLAADGETRIAEGED